MLQWLLPILPQVAYRQQSTDPMPSFNLFPISVQGKWGYISSDGAVVIDPQFVAAHPFRDGLARVAVKGTSEDDFAFKKNYEGFIDSSGKFVIPPEFPDFYPTRNDWDLYGYSDFCDSVAVVSDATNSDGIRGLIDRNGNLIAPMMFNHLDGFGEGRCYFEIHQKADHCSEHQQQGYANYSGEIVLELPRYTSGSAFHNGVAVVSSHLEEDSYDYLIDSDGKKLLNGQHYSSLCHLGAGLLIARRDGEARIVDKEGFEIISAGTFDRIWEPTSGSLCLGEKGGQHHCIKPSGRVNQLPQLDFKLGRFCDEFLTIRDAKKWGYATRTGEIVVEPIYNSLSPFDGELAKFCKDQEDGYINRDGKIVWSTHQWDLSLQYSVGPPLINYLPTCRIEVLPFSRNWDCKNIIVFAFDGTVEELRKWFLQLASKAVEVSDHTDFNREPGKLEISITADDLGFTEIYALHGDYETSDPDETDGFVDHYCCENMIGLRREYPQRTIGIMFEH